MKNKFPIIFFLFIILVAFIVLVLKKPKQTASIRQQFEQSNSTDTLINDSRHVGFVNLDKFLKLALKNRIMFDSSCFDIRGDSIKIIVRSPNMFYGNNNGDWWLNKFKDLPVNIYPDFSFSAKVMEIKNERYLYIPYQMLFCLIECTGDNNQPIVSGSSASQDSQGNNITIQPDQNFNQLQGIENLVQTNDKVHKHVSDLLSLSGERSGSSYKQIKFLWKYVYDNWIYVHDPAVATDTWRTAAQTIDTYYSTTNKKYTGDCDDFAILMASIALEIGLKSRVVCAVNNEGGHAFSEFFVPSNQINDLKKDIKSTINYVNGDNGIWVNMDWGSKEIGGPYFEGRRINMIN